MAKYNVKHSCGHEAMVELFKSEKERKAKIEYLEKSGLCSECYRAKLEAEKATDCEEVEMGYGEYKKNFANCKTKKDSYNADTKTIIVYVKKS